MKSHDRLQPTPISAYPAATAVRLMTARIPTIQPTATITDIEKLLEEKTDAFETINYVYVVDEKKTLCGVLSIKEVFRQPAIARVSDILSERQKPLVTVKPHTDQEHLALLALKHNLKAIPVVDDKNQLLGAVTSDTILRILDSEAVENILRFGGVYHTGTVDNVLTDSLSVSIKHRLPWLVLGLVGGLSAAGIIEHFEGLLSRHLILAAFIPLIVYMADAVGTQMEAFIIRDLALNPRLKFLTYLAKHSAVVLLIGLLLSFLLFGASFLLHREVRVSIVLGIALFFAIVSSLLTGLIVPYLFSKVKLDPANASGPTATIIQDVVSVLVYFVVASWVL